MKIDLGPDKRRVNDSVGFSPNMIGKTGKEIKDEEDPPDVTAEDEAAKRAITARQTKDRIDRFQKRCIRRGLTHGLPIYPYSVGSSKESQGWFPDFSSVFGICVGDRAKSPNLSLVDKSGKGKLGVPYTPAWKRKGSDEV